jgi:hypothetical protein
VRDLNPKIAADGQGTFCSELLLSHLLILLCTVFHTFLKLFTSNKKYTLKNESIFPRRMFKENPPL